MSATPTYDAVVEALRVDPQRISARPAWSLQAAQQRCEQQRKALPATTSAPPRQQQVMTRPPLGDHGPSTTAVLTT